MSQDAHNLLRPESVETFYILWKATGDPRYKQWAWQVRCTVLRCAVPCRAVLCCACSAPCLPSIAAGSCGAKQTVWLASGCPRWRTPPALSAAQP